MSDTPDNPEKKSTVDKIIMGAIIGTAIGSAISLTVAPKKGKETRADVKKLSKETAGGLFRLGKGLLRRLLRSVSSPVKTTSDRTPQAVMKELPDEMEIIPPKPKA